MKPERLIEILTDRGFRVLLKDGVPVLIGDRKELTPRLETALKANRAELIEYLRQHGEEIPV